MRCLYLALTIGALAPVLAACIGLPAASPALPANRDVILATTTSTVDTGLLDALRPMFEQKTGYRLKTIAVGSGQAMALGERGEADVLLVHAPDSEMKFMQAGHGVNRRLVMHNDFVIVGPAADPAGTRGEASASAALQDVAASAALFIGRGDNSGTDHLEKKLWTAVGIDPGGQVWYQETGQGMGATLAVASERRAYTIADRGTYLQTSKNLDLAILVQGDPALLNVYHVIEVDPRKSSRTNVGGATAFADFLVEPETQRFIAAFGVAQYGQPFFFPDAGKDEAEIAK